MTRSDKALLRSIERQLKAGKKIFVGVPEFREHPNLPQNAVVISDDRLTGRLKEDGYVALEDTVWRFEKKITDSRSQHLTAHVVKRLTEHWAKEVRDYDRHLIAIAAFVIGIIGAALTIFRDFWR